MDQTQIWIIVAVVVVLAIILIVAMASRRRNQESRAARIEGKRDRYGPEFDRQAERLRSSDAAEQALDDRARQLRQRELSPSERQRYREDWDRVEGNFLDRPALALGEAERLVGDLMRDRGYRSDDPQDAAMDLSITHGSIAERYRAGSRIVSSGSTDIGQMREAMLHFRTVVDDLLAVEVRGEPRRVDPS
jgi:hypothetical protein